MGTVYQVCVWYVYGMYGMPLVWVWYGMDTYTSRHGTWQGLGKKESRLLWMHIDPRFNMASYLT